MSYIEYHVKLHFIFYYKPEGSGKSSLLKIISGLVAPSAGTIYLSRKDLYKNPIFGRAFVGYCPPENLLFPDLTVEETLQFFAEV